MARLLTLFNRQEWTPASLTGLAATVLPALSRSQGKLWQDTGKTIPAVADGDPVRVAVCPYTAVEFTALSDAARPLLYEEGGGLWSLSFDGVDDHMITAATYAGPATASLFGALISQGVNRGKYIFGANDTGATALDVLVYQSGGDDVAFYTTSVTPTTVSSGAPPALSQVAWSRVGGVYDGSTVAAYVDNVVRGTPQALTGNVRQLVPLAVSAQGGSSFAGRYAGVCYYNSALDSTDRGTLDAYLAALTP